MAGAAAVLLLFPSLILAILIGFVLLIWVRIRYVNYRDRMFIHRALLRYGEQTEPPSDLPAAAVSVLRGREVTSRTLGTIVIEMCQKGVLRITPVARMRRAPLESGQEERYDYRLTVRGQSNLDWERTLCDAMRDREVTPEWLKSTLEDRRGAIGKQLGQHLKEWGLFNSNPMSGFRLLYWLWWLGTVLAGCSILSAVAAAIAFSIIESDSIGLSIFFVIVGLISAGVLYMLFLLQDRRQINMADRSRPNDKGLEELYQWLAFRQTSWRQSSPAESEESSEPYPCLSYAFALGVEKPWMYSGIAGTLLPDNTDTVFDPVGKSTSGAVFRPADSFFIGWIAADFATGAADHSGADISGDMDMDIDIDLSS